jgi:hypothetical protein
MPKLSNQTIVEQNVDLTMNENNVLGPNLLLDRCNVTLRVTERMLTFVEATFINCDVAAKKQLNNCRWFGARLSGCRFHGRFLGNDFGNQPEDYWKGGGIDDCDFSDAVLEACRVIGSDAKSIVFPTWPCITLLNPCEYRDQMSKMEWPGRMGIWVKTFSYPPPTTTALVEYAPSLMKRYEVSEQELIVAISRLPNLLHNPVK